MKESENIQLIIPYIEEYKALRNEMLEFQKTLFKSTTLFLTVIIGAITLVITKYSTTNQFVNLLKNQIVCGFLLIIPIIIFVFGMLVITYDIEIQAASLYILKLGKNIAKIYKSKEIVFGWESVAYRPKSAIFFEICTFFFFSLLILGADLLIIIGLSPYIVGSILVFLYYTSIFCTMLYVINLIIFLFITLHYSKAEKNIEKIDFYK